MKKPFFISIVCLVIFFAYSFDLYAQDSLPKSNAVPTGEKERVNTRTVTNEDFDKIVLQSNIPVLVNFFADWSGPCKTQAPILGELAQELDGKVKFVKVDIDMEGNKDLAVEYGVLSVPTLILFSNGETKETMVGVTSKNKLKQKLEQANLQEARSESKK
jgi:thioredoxin 1